MTYPSEGKDDVLTFTEWNKKLRVPFTIFCDMDTFCTPISNCSPDNSKAYTNNIQRFEPCGFGYQVMCSHSKYTKKPVIYRGPDVAKKFIEELLKEKLKLKHFLKTLHGYT